jgi:hypothetical protein
VESNDRLADSVKRQNIEWLVDKDWVGTDRSLFHNGWNFPKDTEKPQIKLRFVICIWCSTQHLQQTAQFSCVYLQELEKLPLTDRRHPT